MAKGPKFLNLGEYNPDQKIYVGRAHNIPPEFKGEMHRHTHYELMWLDGGATVFFSDFDEVDINAGTMMFIRPGQLHTLRGNLNTIDLTVISFLPDLLATHTDSAWFMRSQPFFGMGARPYLFADEMTRLLLSNLFKTILTHYKEYGESNRELLASYVQVLLSEAKRLYEPETGHENQPTSAGQLTKAFYDAVESNFLEHRTTSPYADQLGVTANHLTRIVRETTGMTPGKILRDRLLLESKRLLVHSDQTVNQIADELGFGSAAQFSNWFKREAENPPSDFRKAYQLA